MTDEKHPVPDDGTPEYRSLTDVVALVAPIAGPIAGAYATYKLTQDGEPSSTTINITINEADPPPQEPKK